MATAMPATMEMEQYDLAAQLRAALLEALDSGLTESDLFRLVVEALREAGFEATPGLFYVRPTQRSSRGH
jgi:hypothetical protein